MIEFLISELLEDDSHYYDLVDVSCIYRIYRIRDQKSYIGKSSSLGRRLYSTKFGHLFRLKNGVNHPLYNDIRKEGPSNFKLEVLSDRDFSEEEFFIDKYNSYDKGYNKSKNGTGYDFVPNKGRIRITNGTECKFVEESDLKDYLDLGWEKDTSSTMTGRLWAVNEEGLRHAITEDQIQEYNNKGYAHGLSWDSATPFSEEFPELDLNWRYRTIKQDLMELRNSSDLGLESSIKDCRLIQATSGSTGKNLFVPYNQIDIEAATIVGSRCFKNAGVVEGMKVIHCFNYRMHSGGMLDTLSLMKTGANVIPFGIGGTHELIQTILDLKIEAISCTPSYLPRIQKILLEDFNKEPKDLGLKLGLFGGEGGIDDDKVRKSLEDLWGFSAINANYGSADTMSIFASENFEEKDGLVFLAPDYLDVELYYKGEYLPIDNDITNIGELVISTRYKGGLQNLNRYRMGDLIQVKSKEDCFKFNIVGRADDMLVIKGINVFPGVIRNTFTMISNLFRIPGSIQVHVSAKNPITEIKLVTDITDEEVLFRLRKELSFLIPLELPIVNSEIITGNTGKTKLVIRDL